MVIDFHSHVLPGIDDGSKDTEMSIAMLSEMYAQGIDVVVATPHFYNWRQSIDEFLEKRNEAYYNLQFAIDKAGAMVPKIILGAEVAYTSGLENFAGLERLCIGDTNKMLLEMPGGEWSNIEFNGLVELIFTKKIDVIIAHYERYTNNHKKVIANRILKLPVWVQANCESFSKFMSGKKLLESLKDGEIQFIGTDCHNMKERPVNMFKFRRLVETKLGREVLERIDEETRKALNL